MWWRVARLLGALAPGRVSLGILVPGEGLHSEQFTEPPGNSHELAKRGKELLCLEEGHRGTLLGPDKEEEKDRPPCH